VLSVVIGRQVSQHRHLPKTDILPGLLDIANRMDQERKKKILSYLGRCQNGPSKAENIAHYLGFLSTTRPVIRLLKEMKVEGLVTSIGHGRSTLWQLSGAGSQPAGAGGATDSTGDTQFSGLVDANRSADSTKACSCRQSVQLGFTELKMIDVDVDDNNPATSRQPSASVEQSQRRSDATVHVSCLSGAYI